MQIKIPILKGTIDDLMFDQLRLGRLIEINRSSQNVNYYPNESDQLPECRNTDSSSVETQIYGINLQS